MDNSTQSIGRLPPYKTHSVRDSWDWFWIGTLLSFHSHIEQIFKKISSGIFVLRNLRNRVNTNVLMAAYHGLIYINLADVVLIWGHESEKTIFVFKQQKRVVALKNLKKNFRVIEDK